MTQIIDGRFLAQTVQEKLATLTQKFIQNYNISPGLAVVRVGNDSASEIYVSIKRQQANKLGYFFKELYFKETVSQNDVLAEILRLNQDDTIHGIILQLPIPQHLNKKVLIQAISPNKDVDGLHPFNAGLLAQGLEGGMIPCTPLGCLRMLESVYNGVEKLKGAQVLVVGRSLLVGRPLASLLINQGCTVTIAHSQTKHLKELCQQAEILIAAIGQPNFIKGDWIKKGAVVLDVGITRISDNIIVGDIDSEAAFKHVRAISPVPGGVGPMTVVSLLGNTLIAAFAAFGVDISRNYEI